MDSGLWTMDYGLWTMDYGLWTMDYGLYGLYGLWIMDSGLWTLDYGLWIMDYMDYMDSAYLESSRQDSGKLTVVLSFDLNLSVGENLLRWTTRMAGNLCTLYHLVHFRLH